MIFRVNIKCNQEMLGDYAAQLVTGENGFDFSSKKTKTKTKMDNECSK